MWSPSSRGAGSPACWAMSLTDDRLFFSFLKNISKVKFCIFLFMLYIFVYTVRGQPFLMMIGDQTSLRGGLCPTSDFICAVTMFIILSQEGKTKLVAGVGGG